jgi:hypothetical protein
MNPAHPGVGVLDIGGGARYFSGNLGSPVESGLGQQTFGETAVDAYPLNDYWKINNLPPPIACWDSPGVTGLLDGHWSIKTWTVTSSYTNGGPSQFVYRRRTVVLPSGVAVTIFRTFLDTGGDFVPPDVDPTYSTHYRADAYLFLSAYQGGPYGVVRNPEIWSDAYTAADPPYPYNPGNGRPKFGIEFNPTPQAPFLGITDVDYQAFRRGMTVIWVQPGCGVRPLYAAISQLIEVCTWLDGNYDQPGGPPKPPHRKVLRGGSIAGFHAVIAATYLPWLFRGAITEAAFLDTHANLDWISSMFFTQQQLFGYYYSGVADTWESPSHEWNQYIDLQRGYIPGLATGDKSIAGYGLDYAATGFFASQLVPQNAQITIPELIIPVVNLCGDEDPSQYRVLDAELQSNVPNPHKLISPGTLVLPGPPRAKTPTRVTCSISAAPTEDTSSFPTAGTRVST